MGFQHRNGNGGNWGAKLSPWAIIRLYLARVVLGFL